jgi:hypothetical protein
MRTTITLSDDERRRLEKWTRNGTTEQRHAVRAGMILMLADGSTNEAVAREFDVRVATVSKWRTRFAEQGLEGLFVLLVPASRRVTAERRSIAFWSSSTVIHRRAIRSGTGAC